MSSTEVSTASPKAEVSTLARQAGSTPNEASAAAGRYMAEIKQVVVA